MRGLIAAIALTVFASPALADYGTPEACSLFSKGVELPKPLPDNGSPYFFDGKTVFGTDWSCEAATGKCESEGSVYVVKFGISSSEGAVTLTGPDGTRTSLARCD